VRKIELLRELQDIDTALDRARGELEEKRARCGDESDLVPLRVAVASARRRLHELEVKAKELDDWLEMETSKRKAEERKLYDGSVKNPKELTDLSQKLELHKAQISEMETKALLNMEALEATSAELEEAERILRQREIQWTQEQATLEQECATLAAEVERLNADRERVAGQLDPATLRSYETIRRARGGLAVVPVEQRACKGCRISLSSSEFQRARSSQELVTCQSCGRILYLP